jgi:integrase
MRTIAKKPGEFMFTGRSGSGRSITTRQYARLVSAWIASIGLDPHLFGTHSLRRTKATLIYRRTGNLRAVQLLLGHTKVESTVRSLGIKVDDALAIAEQVDRASTLSRYPAEALLQIVFLAPFGFAIASPRIIRRWPNV